MEDIARTGVSQAAGGGPAYLTAPAVRKLDDAFEQMDLLLATEEPEEGLNCLLRMLSYLREVRRELR